MPNETKSRETAVAERFHEIEEKYREGDTVLLGNATPDELRELASLDRELKELRGLGLLQEPSISQETAPEEDEESEPDKEGNDV